MTRFKASFIHLLISLIVIGSFVMLVLYVWYPKPLFSIANVIAPLKLLVLIDVVIGPLLTFIVFSKKKSLRLLRMDLTFIALMQISALSYGIYTVYNGRSSIVAFADGKFHYLVEKYANNKDLSSDVLQPSFFAQPKMAYISTLNTLDIYGSYADLQPLTDISVLEAYALSVDNMKAKFKSKVDDIDKLVATYPDDDIKFFFLDKDMATSYVVFSMKKNRIIDELTF